MDVADQADVPSTGDESDAPGETSLAALIRRLSNAQNLDEIKDKVTRATRSLLLADGATLVLRDGDRCFYVEEDAISPLWKGRRFPMGSCISGWCMIHDEPVAVVDIYRDSRIPADAYRPTFVRSLAMAPVRAGKPLAAIGAYWAERHQASPAELAVLQTIANAAAPALAAHLPAPSDAEDVPAERMASAPRPRLAATIVASIQQARREGLKPGSAAAYAFAIFCVAVATLSRWAIGELGASNITPFTTYYPAALIAVLAGGPRAGVLAVLLGGASAWWAFMPADHRPATADPSHLLNGLLYLACNGLIIFAIARHLRREKRLAEEEARNLTVARELQHRARNNYAVVHSIVTRGLPDNAAAAAAILERISATMTDDIAETPGTGWESLRPMLAAKLEAFGRERFRLDGADLLMETGAAANLELALHELATNATKHGALSAPGGRIEIGWREDGGAIELNWVELGGPAISPPRRRGFGATFLQRVASAAGGVIDLSYPPEGLQARIAMPLRRLRAD